MRRPGARVWWLVAVAALSVGAACATGAQAAPPPGGSGASPAGGSAAVRSHAHPGLGAAARVRSTRWAVDRRTTGLGEHSARGVRSVPLGAGSQTLTLDRNTGTAYVSSDEGVVSVVDIAHCNGRVARSCARPIARLAGRSGGVGLAVYQHTLYVSSGTDGSDGAVSVYDVAHCHSGDTSHCAKALAVVKVADGPVGLALDGTTGTLYVGNAADHVDVLALASCRRAKLTGCAHAVVGSIPATDGPVFPTVDAAHHTLYVPANGPGGDGSGDTVHVVDLRHCRAGDTTGCSAPQASLPADTGAVIGLLDGRTGTLYVQNQTAHDVSVIDVRGCTGAVHTGCAQTPANVPVGVNPSGGLVETTDGRLYVANSDADTLSTFDTRHCRAGDHGGCPRWPVHTARADGAPFWLGYDPSTGTIFTAEHAGQALGVISASACDRQGHGCRHLLPSVRGNQQQLADDAVHTWYGVDGSNHLTLTDTRLCTAFRPAQCTSAAIHTTQANTAFGQLIADDSTHSLYLINNDLNTYRGSVVVLNTKTCNAAVHTDCSPVAPPMPLPNYTAVVTLDPASHTLYVTTQDHSTLQVIDGTRCNATVQTACTAPVGAVPLAGNVYGVAVDHASGTVYVSEFGQDFDSNVMYAVDGTHCRATDVSGCGHAPKRFTSGLAPLGLVDDPAHHSLFVLANAGGQFGGQLDVFDTRTCNARTVTGCKPRAAFDVGRAPFVGRLDPVTQHLFVADFEHAAVTVINTATCNAAAVRGCRDRQFDMGDEPGQVAVDPGTHSAFVLGATYTRTYYLDTRVR